MAQGSKKPAKGIILAVLVIAGTILGSTLMGGGSLTSSTGASQNKLASMTPDERRAYYEDQNAQIEGMQSALESNALGAGGCDTQYTDCYIATYGDLYTSVQSALPFAQADRDTVITHFYTLFSQNFTQEQKNSIESKLKEPRSSAFESNVVSFFEGMNIVLTEAQVTQAVLANEMANNVRIRLRFIDQYEARFALYCTKDSEDDKYVSGEVTMAESGQTYGDTCSTDGTQVVERLCTHGEYKENDTAYNVSHDCEYGCVDGACLETPAFGGLEIVLESDQLRPENTTDITVNALDATGEIDTDYIATNLRFELVGSDLPDVLLGTFALDQGTVTFEDVSFAASSAGTYELRVINNEDSSATVQTSITIIDVSPATLVIDAVKTTSGTGSDTVANYSIRVEMHDITDVLVDTYTTDKLRFTLIGADLSTAFNGHLTMTNGIYEASDFITELGIGSYTLMVTDDNASPSITGQTTLEVTSEAWRPACATQVIYVSCTAKGGRGCTTNACPLGCVPREANAANNSCFKRADMDLKFGNIGWKLYGRNSCDTNANQRAKERTLKSRCIVAPGY